MESRHYDAPIARQFFTDPAKEFHREASRVNFFNVSIVCCSKRGYQTRQKLLRDYNICTT
jgi:hypothetical protein